MLQACHANAYVLHVHAERHVAPPAVGPVDKQTRHCIASTDAIGCLLCSCVIQE